MRDASTTEKLSALAVPLVEWRKVWRLRNLIVQMVKRDILARYKGSVMGILWLIATPVVMLAVYTFIFSVVFQVRWPDANVSDSKLGFALILFCGLSVYNIFAETILLSATVISGNPNYVKKVVFPLEILPLVKFLTALFFGTIWFGVLLLGIMTIMHIASWSMFALPLVLLPLFFLTCGLAWLVAALGVFFRDVSHMLSILLQAMFYMTPILYELKIMPARFHIILRLNPLTDIVENVRRVLIYGQWPDWGIWSIMLAASLVVSKLGYLLFMKSKRGFSDVL